MRILGEDFARVWDRICKDSVRLWERSHKGFARNRETLREHLQGFSRLWERICKTLGEDLQGFMQDFGKGFAMIH